MFFFSSNAGILELAILSSVTVDVTVLKAVLYLDKILKLEKNK